MRRHLPLSLSLSLSLFLSLSLSFSVSLPLPPLSRSLSFSLSPSPPLYRSLSLSQALARAIKEAKEQHPDMAVTKVVVHQETEITPELDYQRRTCVCVCV